jgi:hypothetical protein
MGSSHLYANGSVNRAAKLTLVLATIVNLLFLVGCGDAPSSRTEKQVANVSRPTPTPREERYDALVYVNEALLKKPFAIIGGTIENTSRGNLSGLTVEIELQRRSDGSKERRTIDVSPAELAPGERGSYSLKVLSEDWSDSRLVAVRSASNQKEVAFKLSPGNRRPPERLVAPSPGNKVVQPASAKRRRGDEEFINSPDDPVKVP